MNPTSTDSDENMKLENYDALDDLPPKDGRQMQMREREIKDKMQQRGENMTEEVTMEKSLFGYTLKWMNKANWPT